MARVYQLTEKDLQDFLSLRGVRRASQGLLQAAEQQQKKVREIAESMRAEILRASAGDRELAELIVSGDISVQADILDRLIVANFRDFYKGMPQRDLGRLCVPRPVADFRDFKTILYGEFENLEEVRPGERLRTAIIDVDEETLSMKLYALAAEVTWQAFVNDREGILTEIPNLLATAAQRTRQRLIAEAIGLAANRTLMYSLANGNLFALALTQTNLETVLAGMALLPEPNSGEPRGTVMATLVVPLALELTAQRLVQANKDTLAIQTLAGNIVNYNLDYIASPMLDRYTSSGWWLFCRPVGSQGPVVEAFVRGMQDPELLIRKPNAQILNGPDIPESFNGQTIAWATRMPRRFAWILKLFWMTSYSDQNS